jgi:lipoate-protein ligase B
MANAHKRTLSACFYGFEKPYEEYLQIMHDLHDKISQDSHEETLMLLEHKHVITLTRQHQERSLLTSVQAIKNDGIDLCIADRGGDVTFHGPGQLVGYPLISMQKSPELSLESYVRGLENALLKSLHTLGLKKPQKIPGFTGIWIKSVDRQKLVAKKLCAIGIGVKNGVTKHGFALNLTINAQPFVKHIIPCGLKDRGIATVQEAFLKEHLEMPDYLVIVKEISKNIAEAFSLELCCKGLIHG